MPLELSHLSDPVAAVLAGYPALELPLLRSQLRAHPQLDKLARQPATQLFPGARAPECAHSGLLLLLGGWEQSHKVSQDITGPEGSYWHAIAHRMEPDESNSRYWFRRVGAHPVFEQLRRDASTILESESSVVRWNVPDPWDPAAFLHLCERAVREETGPHRRVATAIHSLEWRLLFEWCAVPAPQ